MDALFTAHRWLGYAVLLVALVCAFLAFSRAKDSREFSAAPFSLAAVLIDIQVLLGLVIYAGQQAWERGPMIAYVHPALMLLALAAAHMAVGRARREQMVAAAHRRVGKGLIVSVVLLIAGIGVATAA